MSQAFGSNYGLGSYNPYQNYGGSTNAASGNAGNGGYGYNNTSPMFGPMQGGGMSGDTFGSGSPSENYMNSLLNIGPLESQYDQLTGGQSNADPSSPLAYVQSTIDPIMQGAEQSYDQGMGITPNTDNTDGSDTSGTNNSNSSPTFGSQSYYNPTGGNPFSTGSASQDYMNSLLNIGPLETQYDQLTGGQSNVDPSSPQAYVQSTIDPIMEGAEQSYHEAMNGSQQGSSNSNSSSSSSSSSNSGSSSSNPPPAAPTSIPLEDDGSSSSSSGDSSSSGGADDGSDSGS